MAEFTGADEGKLRMLLQAHGGPPPMRPGSAVRLFGLQSKPEANGRRGAVRGYDATKGRYAVELEAAGGADAETLSLKRDNLALCLQAVPLRAMEGAELPSSSVASYALATAS